MIELSELRGRHSGQCIAVLGGGPTLLDDLRRVPPDAVLIGVNQHALLLNLDYVHYLDEAVYEAVRHGDAPRCTHHRAQADIYTGIVPVFDLSGASACWIADYLGADQIILAGCDNYTSGRRYWHSLASGGNAPSMTGLDPWNKCRDYMTRPEIVRAVSGPLTKVFAPL